ncbi:hypothetical protein [Ruegeria jejuensis]|uniref:hypothetical protein n=1 Tax=Ruegeria jejuensis TaxID=3233338 RepID=UPI00355B7508
MIELSSKGIRLSFDPDLGIIQSFHVSDREKEIAPLHLAPWVGSGETLPDDIAPHLKKLGGDFSVRPLPARKAVQRCMAGRQTLRGAC